MVTIKYIFILFLICAVNIAVSQQSKTDSLLSRLQYAKHDTVKINLLNELSRIFRKKSDYKQAMDYAQTAIRLSEKLISSNDSKLHIAGKKGMALIYNNIGLIYAYQSDFEKAKSYYFKALKIYEEIEDKEGIAIEWGSLGNIASDLGDYANALKFHNKALLIRVSLLEEQKNNSIKSDLKINRLKNLVAGSHNNIGTIYYAWGDYNKSLSSFFSALNISEETNDKYSIAPLCNNIGEIQRIKGDYEKAVEYYEKALSIYKEMNESRGMSATISNLGLIYYQKKDYQKALEYYFMDLEICKKAEDKQGIAYSCNNIGTLYADMAEKFMKSDDVANTQTYYNKSIEFYLKSLKIGEEIGDKQCIGNSLFSIGKLYLKQNKIATAREYMLHSLQIAKEINTKPDLKNIYESLSECDSSTGNFKGAYNYQKLYSAIKDSIFNEESNKQITEMNTKYETEKKEKEIEIQNLQIGQQTLELNKKQIVIYAVLGGLILVLSLVVIVFRSYRQKKKDNEIITLKNAELEQANEEICAQRDEIEAQRDRLGEQNEILAEQKKEITDSINYAKHIQQAILPDLENIGFSDLGFGNFAESNQLATSNFKPQTSNFFVLFKPKDIVSGDFYWATKVNNWLIVTVADCTGHGVPGAFMSMLGVSFLNEIVRKKEITKASEVLDNLRASIIDALQQKGQSEEQKDGMDMSLIAIKLQNPSSKFQNLSEENDEQLNNRTIEQSNHELQTSNYKLQTSNFFNAQWAGANNPLWIVRSSKNLQGFENLGGLGDDAFANDKPQTSNFKLFEIKPDKQPVAICESIKPFTNHELQLYKGDILYFASDGFEDQFGGAKYKKFMSRQLKETLVSISSQPMSEQKQILENTFISWKGENEQIDDVTILGLKI